MTERPMWLASFLILITVMLWRTWVAGPYHAWGVGFFLSLLVPTWLTVPFFGLPMDMRVAVCLVGLAIVVACHPTTFFRVRLVALDFLGLGFVATTLLSDWTNEGFGLRAPLLSGGEWVLPYVAGRLTLQRLEDVRRLLPWVVGVCLVLSFVAASEAISGTNVLQSIFGAGEMHNWFVGAAGRWGLETRATGSTKHPICFGTLLLLLLPWTIYAAARAWRGAASGWWLLAPPVAVSGIIFAASRAPILGIVPLAFAALVVVKPRWRLALGGTATVAIAVLAISFGTVVEMLEKSVNDAPTRRVTVKVGNKKVRIKKAMTVQLDGEEVERSSARTRLHVFQVYEPAMRAAGLLGFGTARIASRPMRVPVAPENAHLLSQMWVENEYIMMILRFGYGGLICFVAAGLLALATFARLGWVPGQPGVVFYAGMTGGILATLLVLLTVWMPPDFGFVFIWNVGAAAGLLSGVLAQRS